MLSSSFQHELHVQHTAAGKYEEGSGVWQS